MPAQEDVGALLARETREAGELLTRATVQLVKKNPIKLTLYFIGLLIFTLFSGWKVDEASRQEFYRELQKVDHDKLDSALYRSQSSYQNYRTSSGWFSCNALCQERKKEYDFLHKEHLFTKQEHERQMALAKSKLGIFSEYGVEEAKNIFWNRLSQGKGFASRQSKWDALFLSISAMGRDENLLSYLLRLILNVLFNITLGIMGAVIAFVASLPHLLASYQVSWSTAFVFFSFASLAAVSYALTWLLGVYGLFAGATFVVIKVASISVSRIEGGSEGRRRRVHY
jgi:hypothetical protein